MTAFNDPWETVRETKKVVKVVGSRGRDSNSNYLAVL